MPIKKGLDKARSLVGSMFGGDISKLKVPRPEKIEVDRSKLTIHSGRELPSSGLSGLPKSISSGLPQSGLSPGLPGSVSSGLPKSSSLSSLPNSTSAVSQSQRSLNEVQDLNMKHTQSKVAPKSLEQKIEAVAQRSKEPGEKQAAVAALQRLKSTGPGEVKEVVSSSGSPLQTATQTAAKSAAPHSAFQEAMYGAGIGAVSGGALSFLQGGSILEGAMYGAGFGAGFSGAASMAGKHFNHRGKLSDKSNATWNLSQRGVSRHAPGANGGEASKLGLRHYQMAGGIGGFLGSSNRKKNSNHLKANGWANGTHPMYFR
jgi:hypothetical protein